MLNLHNWQKVLESVIILSDMKYMEINVREYRRGNRKWTIHKNWQHIWYTRRRKTKQKHNIICVGHPYAQTNTKPSHMFLMQKYVCNSTICGRYCLKYRPFGYRR
jgi:hypothetical protein